MTLHCTLRANTRTAQVLQILCFHTSHTVILFGCVVLFLFMCTASVHFGQLYSTGQSHITTVVILEQLLLVCLCGLLLLFLLLYASSLHTSIHTSHTVILFVLCGFILFMCTACQFLDSSHFFCCVD